MTTYERPLVFDPEKPLFAASEVWSIVTALGERGVDATQMLLDCGLSLDLLIDPRRRVTLAQITAVYRFAVARLPLAALVEVAGCRQHLTAFGMVGFAMLSSPTLDVALSLTQRFWPLVNARFAIRLETEGSLMRLRLDPLMTLAADIAPVLAAVELRKLSTFLYDLLGERGHPMAVGMDAATAPYLADWAATRARPCTGLWLTLPTAFLHQPLIQGHAITHQAAMVECERLMTAFDRFPALVERVRGHFTDLQYGVPSLSEIAHRMAMSERTLRRRLDALGTSYSHILEEIRYTAACGLLVDKGMTTDDIAERLGYTETANFRHAFKRWAGQSPLAYRHSQVGVQ